DDGKAEATTSSRAGTRAVCTIKALKDVRKVSRVDAGACIAYPDGKETIFQLRSNGNLATGRGVTAGVVEQVEQHLRNAVAVSQYKRCGWGNFIMHCYACLLTFGSDHGEQFIKQFMIIQRC